MSFWDKYLAPGDIRNPPSKATRGPAPPTKDASTQVLTKPFRVDAATRQRRQDATFYGGILFTLLSLLVTRRALRRKLLTAHPPTLPHGVPTAAGVAGPPNPVPKALDSGPLDAIEALGLATLNVFSVAMFGLGCVMKGFNVADLEDLRDGVRKGVGFDVYGGQVESEADKEMEGWAKEWLESRKDGPAIGVGELKDGILGKLAEIEGREREGKAEGKRS
ncbi:hypothetical protein LTR78_005857 [Recurvomyces mirabilis]|uniref:Altered inheritance of mitochondria protein 11 n=1 Tax=Recurvomyces mirabilis TaxID=574656 RepID=A0AAE0WMH2_9PEZI|nr:hypothetical protein LTR78_005857 [Recurvomyces mirabilis]KAK5154238.1 hypothetical protein LTS14_006923 [Recurvomyces mirabilis]